MIRDSMRWPSGLASHSRSTTCGVDPDHAHSRCRDQRAHGGPVEVVGEIRARLRVQQDGVRAAGELGVVHVESRVDDGDRLAGPGRSELRGVDRLEPPLRAGKDSLTGSAREDSAATGRPRSAERARGLTSAWQQPPRRPRRQRPDLEIVLDERCSRAAQRSCLPERRRSRELDEQAVGVREAALFDEDEEASPASRRTRPRRARRAGRAADAAGEGRGFSERRPADDRRARSTRARLTSRSSSSRSRRRPRARARTRAAPWPSPGVRSPSSRRP